ncbi:carboxypeptidase-like regulatory domain-containing protein [Winogradskyella sp. PE311]|uniref:carboxypeptidase-like regulatory domain-containing protein n=1 Tax=Winogradskyella sp. PE311 TaxID=3366943 RepID=UPI00397F800C
MRKAITINIPEPCHEDWNNMTPKEQGRHCAACNKTVIDFTKKTDESIIKTIESEGKLCGRFKSQQLNRKLILQRKYRNNYMSLVASGLFAFFALGNQDIHAQGKPRTVKVDSLKTAQVKGKIATSVLNERAISGTVTTADDGLPLPGASVIIKGTSRGVQTDFDGKYSIKAKIGDILVISFVGCIDKKIVVGRSSTVNISLLLDDTLDEVVVGGIISVWCQPDHSRFPSGGGYFSVNKAKEKWLERNKKRRANWKKERLAKREAIRDGEQERTSVGKFFFGIKRLFSKK